MRQIILVLTILVILIACNNSDTKTFTSNTKIEQQIDTTKSARHILIEELKRLQQIVASNDKEKIAEIFTFPLSDTAFSIYIDDSTYYEQFKSNGNKTTKKMFLQYFKKFLPAFLLTK